MKRKIIIFLIRLGWINDKIKSHHPNVTDDYINHIRNDKRFNWNKKKPKEKQILNSLKDFPELKNLYLKSKNND